MPLAPPTGRLAPSPTGAQHIGNARTYLIAWLSARSRGGSLALRIEDIDSPRVKAGADRAAIEDLEWLGLDWDDRPHWQTRGLDRHEAALRSLQDRGLVYPCTCSHADIEHAASAPHLEHEGPPYPGTCATRSVADAASLAGRPFAWRFRARAELETFADGYLSPVRVAAAHGGDFVVWKSIRSPAYQLAVVVDDAAMGVTEVVRGDDLVPSTLRQIQIYQALGLELPRFVHIPLIVGPDGRRLAKRHGDTRLAALRAQGVQPEALIGLLAWSCGWIPGIEPVRPRELLPCFRLDSIPPQPFVLEPRLLRRIGFEAG